MSDAFRDAIAKATFQCHPVALIANMESTAPLDSPLSSKSGVISVPEQPNAEQAKALRQEWDKIRPVRHMRAADAVLAMPEMQAIRSALLHAATNAARKAYPASPLATRTGTEQQQDDTVRHYLRTNCKVTHESVIAWVVGHE